MASRSSDFFDVNDDERLPSLHRSRSGGYADHLEDKVRWDRRDREREMKRYHDKRYLGSPTSPHQRSSSDRLCVPVFETTSRRVRSNSDIGQTQENSTRGYNVREVRPSSKHESQPSEAIRPSQSPPLRRNRSHHQKKPSITVQVHQENSPPSSALTSPSASLRSPTAQPQLQYQYATLQNRLGRINRVCSPYLKVEPANPRDLTFAKIADQLKGFAFELQVWAHVVNLDGIAKIDARKRYIVEAASRNLDRLSDRVTELDDACVRAKPRDLKFQMLPEVDDNTIFDDEDEIPTDPDPTESLGFVIHSCLHSINLQIQTLKRLSRPLQEAAPEARGEVNAVSQSVKETARFTVSKDGYTQDSHRLADARVR